MEKLGSSYYEQAVKLFEEFRYEEAVINFIKAYELQENRENILEILYSCFIIPNEQEFRENYAKNNQGPGSTDFEDLTIDFIPVSEERFYLFDKEKQEFLGYFDLDEETDENKEMEFQSLLLADTWDFREMLPYLNMKRWSTIYILLNENEKRFMSFFKLPDFYQRYLERVVVLSNTDLMKLFFREYPQFYLPKQIVAKDADVYEKIICELHEERIHEKRNGEKDVFLSICIPTFSRGAKALRSVKNILQLQYDSEIEIIVSNNGSEVGVEEYHQIRDMDDSRIVYHEFAENMQFAGNVAKVLELASGKFVALASDEDLLILDNVNEFLNVLLNNQGAAAVFSAVNSGYYLSKEFHQKGLDSLACALNSNYMTGLTLNMDILRKHEFLKKFEAYRGNVFLEVYPHSAFAGFASEWSYIVSTGIVLWDARQYEAVKPDAELRVTDYRTLENRLMQQMDCLKLLRQVLNMDEDMIVNISLERMRKTYFLLYIAYRERREAFRKFYSWEEVCVKLYQNNSEYWDNAGLSEERKESLKKQTADMFFYHLDFMPMYDGKDSLELRKHKIMAAIAKCQYETGRNIEEIDYEKLQEQVDKMVAGE